MSITYCLLLSILFLSLHACNARPFPVSDNKSLKEKFHVSNQSIDSKKVTVGQETLELTSSNEQGVLNKDSSTTVKVIDHLYQHEGSNQKLKDSKVKQKLKEEENVARKSGAVEVSWLVPRNKNGEKHIPGFNLDYSPPKTHPPSHN